MKYLYFSSKTLLIISIIFSLQYPAVLQAQNIDYIGSYNTAGEAMGVFVDNQYAYVADGYSGLRIIEITDPANPVSVNSLTTLDRARGIDIHGNYAYIADDYAGLTIVDITDHSNMIITGGYDTPCQSVKIYVENNLAYIADLRNGLFIFDAADPSNPELLGNYEEGFIYDVFVRDNLAYLAVTSIGIIVIDISDPANPTFVGALSMLPHHTAVGITVQGNYAYLACLDEGLWVIDITVPSNPEVIGRYITQNSALDVYTQGMFAYVADDEAGLLIYDVSNPHLLIPVGMYDTPGRAADVFAYADYIFVADSESGLQILQFTDGDEIVSIDNIKEPEIKPPLISSFNNDVGVSAIISPPTSVHFGNPFPLITEITNYGSTPQSFDVIFDFYILETDSLVLTDTFNVNNMQGLSVDTITFSAMVDLVDGYVCKNIAYTCLLDDEDVSNDTLFTFSLKSYFGGGSVIIWYGNLDGSPITSTVSSRIYIDTYILGPLGNGVIANICLPLGTDDNYIANHFSDSDGIMYYPFTAWDHAAFENYCGSPPNAEGWSSQSFIGFADTGGGPNPWLITDVPTKLLTFVVETVSDTIIFEDTAACFASGMDPYQPPNCAGTTCGFGHTMYQFFSPVYFEPSDPCAYLPGDINGDNVVIGSDIIYGVRAFMGQGNPPPDSCWNRHVDNWIYAAADANGSCDFTGADIVYLVGYFKGNNPPPDWCDHNPPIE